MMKDWQVAGDLAQRGQRADALYLRRQAASTGQLPGVVESEKPVPDFACPLARGPLGEKLKTQVRPTSANWHKKKVRQIYKVLDPQKNGAVRLEQLRDSFQALSVPIDNQTFARYAQDLLPSGTLDPASTVLASDFINFHQEVWANQTAFVRWHAGDPAEAGVGEQEKAATHAALASVPTPMRRSSSAPTGVTIGELRNNELMLRKSFTRHADGPSARLNWDKIPAILQDLGLPGHLVDLVDPADLEVSATDSTDELSFHQTVPIVNKLIAIHEASRQSTPAAAGASKVAERIGAALRYSLAAGDGELSSDDESARKQRAIDALEAALLGDDTPRSNARRAIEAALLGDDDDEHHMRAICMRAQGAIEAALFGDDEDTPRKRAQRAIEAALLGDNDDDDAGAICRRAQAALEAALFGDGEDTPRKRAQRAIEAALLGDDEAALLGDDVDEDILSKKRAQEAIEAALLGDDDLDDLTKLRAQEALEEALGI